MKRVAIKEAQKKIASLVSLSNEFKNSYFFRSPSVASNRRQFEARNSMEEAFFFRKDKKKYEVEISFTVSCSCKNVYVSRDYRVNGVKCNIMKLKNLIK